MDPRREAAELPWFHNFKTGRALILAFSLIFHCRETAGMFSTFNEALALIKYYDQGHLSGLAIDFGKEGIYYASTQGENWWTYYCEPLHLGTLENPLDLSGELPGTRRREIEWYTEPQEAHRLIETYIRFCPRILEKVDQFVSTHFKDRYVMGVHYRGTDKMKSEASIVHYVTVLQEIYKNIPPHRRRDLLLFIATDEQNFIDFISPFFANRICCTRALRSAKNTPPPHLTPHLDPYQCGEDALIDCLLLSKTHFLIRTSSNLSLWSTYLNPSLPVLEINQRIDDEKP